MYLIEKLIIKARNAQSTPVRTPKEIVLNELTRNLLLKKVTLESDAQTINSIIGKINPTKIGIKQKKKANPAFIPVSFNSFEVLNVELSLVYLTPSLENLSRK